MQRLVIVGDAIMVLVEGTARGVDQDRAKRAVPTIECGLGQFDAATQTLQIDLAHTHRAEVYVLSSRGQRLSRADRLGHAGDYGSSLQRLEDGFAVDAGLAQRVLMRSHTV